MGEFGSDRSCALDAAVLAAVADLGARGIPAPEVLFLMATGVGMVPIHMQGGVRLPLGKVAGVPPVWSQVLLHAGRIGDTSVWVIEDAPGLPEHGSSIPLDEAPWVRGFPCWLAAFAGAALCVHTSAGQALPAQDAVAIEPGTLALASDHINLSGRTPLLGLGDSKLGPLFPDQSRLHHAALRQTALALAPRLHVPVREAVVACTLGPALDTPAERRFWAFAGAQVAVQNLATPVLACAHSGLALLGIVAVTDDGDGPREMGTIVAAADKLAPAIEELLVELAPELKRAAAELGVDA